MRINPETGWSNLSGLLSFLCGLLMMLLAHSRVRNFAYEWFYHAHLLLAPLVYIFAGLHMPFLLPWMMLALVLYGLDIAVRVWFKYMKTSARIVQLQSIPLSSDPACTVAVRLGIRVDGRSAVFRPGQFFLLTIPALSYLEAHPFSLCLPAEVSTVDGQATTLLQFAIKPTGQRDSWTQRLVQCAVGDIAYVDGPFGGPFTPQVEDHEHLLLVCGGIGATPCLAILAQLVQVQKTVFPWRSVTLLWSCRGRELFDEFAPLLDQARVICGPDNVLLFDTSAKTDVEQDAAVYKAGRPDYTKIVSHCLKSASRGVPSASPVSVTDKNTVVPASTTSSTLCIEAGETTNGVYHPGSTSSISVEDSRANHALTVFLCGPTAMVAEVQFAITACRRTSVFTDSTVKVRVHEEVFHL
jgi:ferredoxin-NADP reductase